MQQISACQQDHRVQSALAPVKGESIYDLIIGVLVSAIHLYFRIWSCCQSLIAFTAQINVVNWTDLHIKLRYFIILQGKQTTQHPSGLIFEALVLLD